MSRHSFRFLKHAKMYFEKMFTRSGSLEDSRYNKSSFVSKLIGVFTLVLRMEFRSSFVVHNTCKKVKNAVTVTSSNSAVTSCWGGTAQDYVGERGVGRFKKGFFM